MKPKQRRLLLIAALLLVVLALLTGRWLLESKPVITELSLIAPEREAAASETALEQPREREAEVPAEGHEPSKDESLPPATGEAPEAPQANVPTPSSGDSKAEVTVSPAAKAVVTYGVQVFVAATIDEYTLSVNGNSSSHPSSVPLAIERNLFVSDEAIVGRELESDAVVRGYIACGINASHGYTTYEGVNGSSLDCRADRPEFVSHLLGVRARKGPNASIVVVGVEPEQEKSGALWDLGLSSSLPPVHVVSGSKWIVPAASFAHVVSPGSDLLLSRAPDREELSAITPGGAPTHAQLGTWTGDSIATYEGTTMVGSRERRSARIAIDVSCKSDDSSLGQLFLDLLFTNPDLESRLKSRGTAKLESTFTGSGIVTWYDDDARPPVSEIRCTFSVVVELHLDPGFKVDCVYRAHGQLRYLAGLTHKDDGYWSQMWQPRDTFLARESFTIR